MKTTRTEKLSAAQTLALDFIKSNSRNWAEYSAAHNYDMFGNNEADWAVRCPTFRTYQSLAAKGLVKVVDGRYVAA